MEKKPQNSADQPVDNTAVSRRAYNAELSALAREFDAISKAAAEKPKGGWRDHISERMADYITGAGMAFDPCPIEPEYRYENPLSRLAGDSVAIRNDYQKVMGRTFTDSNRFSELHQKALSEITMANNALKIDREKQLALSQKAMVAQNAMEAAIEADALGQKRINELMATYNANQNQFSELDKHAAFMNGHYDNQQSALEAAKTLNSATALKEHYTNQEMSTEKYRASLFQTFEWMQKLLGNKKNEP
ncbi:MAG: hypothetical protein WCF85_15105 [Rhodospirillaceae bacterium]